MKNLEAHPPNEFECFYTTVESVQYYLSTEYWYTQGCTLKVGI